jgi:hypothetical protein
MTPFVNWLAINPRRLSMFIAACIAFAAAYQGMPV